jgi:hypothetical protein
VKRISNHRLLLVGGNDRSLWANRGDLIGELLGAGWEVHGALPPEEPVAYEPLHSIPIHRLPMRRAGMNPWGDLRSIRALRRLVDELRPRCVLAYNPKPAPSFRPRFPVPPGPAPSSVAPPEAGSTKPGRTSYGGGRGGLAPATLRPLPQPSENPFRSRIIETQRQG